MTATEARSKWVRICGALLLLLLVSILVRHGALRLAEVNITALSQEPVQVSDATVQPKSGSAHLASASQGNTADVTTTATRRALLIACSRYLHLDEAEQLEGAGNDVTLMRNLLLERFAFQPEHIRVLSDHDGPNAPTRQNIEKALADLVEVTGQHDFVVLWWAGHGSQQPVPPDNDPDKNFEPDGLDEVFCPIDVRSLEADASGRIINGIVDDEIGAWLQKLTAKGAAVWTIFDTCHSGTLVRGNGTERLRRIPAGRLLGDRLLQVAKDEVKPAATERGSTSSQSPLFELGTANHPRLVALYAAQPDEPTVERPLPPGTKEVHGLLTYVLVQILSQSRTPMTYRELVERIHAWYVSQGRVFPTPMVEGPDVDRFIFDDQTPPARPPFRLRREPNGRLRVTAGAIHGLSHGTVLAVYAGTGRDTEDGPLGYVKVTELSAVTSVVEPCEYEGVPAPTDLPTGARCEIALLDFGLNRLRFAIDDRDNLGRPIAADLLQTWRQQLRRLSQDERSIVRMIDDPRQAEWLVRLDGQRVLMVPAAGWSQRSNVGSVPAFQVSDAPGSPFEATQRALETIARARNLVQLAASWQQSATAGLANDLDVDVQLRVLEKPSETNGQPLQWQENGRVVRAGTRIAIRIENRERTPVDVTLLWVDSHWGITSVFPLSRTTEWNRLPAGGSKTIGPAEVGDETLGLEHLVLLAVRAQQLQDRHDFSYLEQRPLEAAILDPQPASTTLTRKALRGGLEELLATAWQQGGTRGPKSRQSKDYTIRLLSLQVVR